MKVALEDKIAMTLDNAVLVLMVARSLAKAKEGVRISYAAQNKQGVQVETLLGNWLHIKVCQFGV